MLGIASPTYADLGPADNSPKPAVQNGWLILQINHFGMNYFYQCLERQDFFFSLSLIIGRLENPPGVYAVFFRARRIKDS